MLVYRMNAVNENWHYSIEARGVRKKDTAEAAVASWQVSDAA
jgi:hypothetical protein